MLDSQARVIRSKTGALTRAACRQGPPWYVFAAALAAAVYFDHGALGFTAAFAYGTAVRLAHGLEKNRLPLISLPVLALSAFAVYKERVGLWVLCIALGAPHGLNPKISKALNPTTTAAAPLVFR